MSPAPRFDPIVHAPNRLQICALLAATDSAEFAALREELEVSDSVLSKHLRTLAEEGYVIIDKSAVRSRTRTWVSLTRTGRQAFDGHVAELQRIVGAAAAGRS